MNTLPDPNVELPDDLPDSRKAAPAASRVVETFGSDMIHAFCVATGLRFARDQDGDVMVGFSYGRARDCALKVYAYASGRGRSILCVRVVSDKRFREAHCPALLEAINRFHCNRRWPKVYVSPSDNAVTVVCEAQVDLAMGAHQGLVNDFIDTAISSANSFWRSLRETGIPSVQDEWKDEPVHPPMGDGERSET